MARKKSPSPSLGSLSRRERQIMDIIYARGHGTSAEVLEALPDPPSYSAVRALMRILAEKGMLKYRREGARYVFEPVVEARQVRYSALLRVMKSFFNNSPLSVVATLLDARELKISPAELEQLKKLITEKEAQSRNSKP